jgi:small subunit ribosomal protein S20
MPVKKNAFKALRQSKKRAERNKVAKLEIKDARRSVRKALESDETEKALEAAKTAIKLLDRAYTRGIMKLNTVARTKSRLLKKVSAAKAKK